MKEIIYKLVRCKFPFQERSGRHYLIALLLGIWVFTFLWFTEPFELSDFDFKKKIRVIPLYGLFSSLSYALAMVLQNYLFRKYRRWTLVFEAVFMFLALSLSSVFMYIIYRFGIKNYNLDYSYFQYLTIIYLPSLLIVIPFISVARYLAVIIKGEEMEDKNVMLSADVVIQGSGKFEVLKLKREDIVYIKSDNIYVDIFYEENKELNSRSIRIKLSEVEGLLPELVKTHRSYLINSSFFRSLKKEDDKIFLELKHNLTIPVSRGRKEYVLKKLPFATEG